MAALAMRPKLLNRISNEKYQEKDKWRIDDIALGPANELLISGHNLEIPTTFISMYKEDSGKYDNRPEINRSFRQPKPGEQLALFLEGNSIIGLKVESSLRMISTKDMIISKMLNWKRSTTCVCFYRGKLYAASSSTNIVNVCSLDSEEKSDIVLSDMEGDCVLDMVVVMENIYVCTKAAGRALVFSMTGSKKLEFENATQSDAMATSICIHERTELVFVLWNNVQIQLYFQMTSQCFHAFDVTEELHKIRVTTKNILVTLNASNCIVSVYDVGGVIEIGEFENTILSSVKKTYREKSMSHDEENLKDHPANNENLRRESYRDIQRLQERIKELEVIKNELISQQKTLKDNLDAERGKQQKETEKEKSHNIELAKQLSVEKAHRMTEKQNISKVVGEMRGHLDALHSTFLQLEAPTQGSGFIENYPGKLTREAKKWTRAAADSDLHRQTKERASSRSTDSGTSTMSSFSQQGNDFNLEVVSTLDFEGGELEIPGTGVQIDIPAGALEQPEEIKIRIVPLQEINGDIRSFASNSFSVIELLPNNLKLGKPAAVTIPHCIQISKEAERKVAIFMSHHQEGFIPQWTASTEVDYRLEDDNCTIFTCSFCWIKVEVDEKIVEAKKLQIFATVPNISPTYNKSTFTIGYFVDLPGFEKEKDVIEKKPFLFKKDDGQPLIITLRKIVPKFWTQKMPILSRQEISFSKIESSEEEFCVFHLIKKDGCKGIPLCIFAVAQAENEMTLSVRSPVYYS